MRGPTGELNLNFFPLQCTRVVMQYSKVRESWICGVEELVFHVTAVVFVRTLENRHHFTKWHQLI